MGFLYKQIFLNNIIDNVTEISNKTNKRIMLMVKANAYGCGINKVVKSVKGYVDCFGVATVSEATKIKKYTDRIFIMQVDNRYIEYAINNNFEFAVNSFDELSNVINISKRIHKRANVHISIDVGMNRFGFPYYYDFYAIQNELYKINVVGIFTHLAKTDTKYVNDKVLIFDKVFDNLCKMLTYKPLKHIFASGATINTYDTKTIKDVDLCRIGILAYGGILSDFSIKPVVKIYSRVVAVNFIKKGETVGYDCKFKVKKNMYIATVFGGYADGISKNYIGKYVEISSKRCKIIAVCMDYYIVLASKDIFVGDKAYLINDSITLFDRAKELKISTYEVLTSFHQRIKYLYYE